MALSPPSAQQEGNSSEAPGFAGRLEVFEGPSGRRSWPDEVKARIVQESFAAGARVGEVARRHRISPQQLTGWRRAAREGKLALTGEDEAPSFVPLVVSEETAAPVLRDRPDPAGVIEIEVADLVLRVPVRSAPARIAAIVAALRSPA